MRSATFEGFHPLVAERSLVFHPIRGDAQAIMIGGGRLSVDKSHPTQPATAQVELE